MAVRGQVAIVLSEFYEAVLGPTHLGTYEAPYEAGVPMQTETSAWA